MAASNTTTTLDGLFKEIYAPDIELLIPASSKIRKDVPFKEAESVGNNFHLPVSLTSENGATWALAGAGAFTLNNSVAQTMKDAQINGAQLTLRTQFDYESMAKSTTSKKAFKQATEVGIMNMMASHSKMLEIDYLYGAVATSATNGAQGGYGKTLSSANVNATTSNVTFTSASFAPAIWAGLENAIINFWNFSAAQIGGSYTVVSVNASTRVVQVTGSAGDITALDAATAAGLDAFRQGASGASMSGLQTIITNTGTLFNISATTYGLWQGNTYDVVSGSLTLTKVQAGIAAAVNRGLIEDVKLYVSPSAFANMISNEAALRRYDSSYGEKSKNGFRDVQFYGPNGIIDVSPHLFVKPGDAFAVALPKVRRLGGADITFKTPSFEDQIFIQLQTQAGIELRSYSHQAIFLDAPAQTVYFKNIS